MYRVSVITFVTMVLLTLSGVAQTPAPTPAPQEEPPPVLGVPPGYKYEPRGRRDPFVNPIPKPAADAPAAPVVRPPGLKGVLITEANLIGIVSSREPTMNKVVIQAPGNRVYFAARGDALFDAVIKEIRADSVVFTLAASSPRGQPVPARDVVRRVNPVPGENQ